MGLSTPSESPRSLRTEGDSSASRAACAGSAEELQLPFINSLLCFCTPPGKKPILARNPSSWWWKSLGSSCGAHLPPTYRWGGPQGVLLQAQTRSWRTGRGTAHCRGVALSPGPVLAMEKRGRDCTLEYRGAREPRGRELLSGEAIPNKSTHRKHQIVNDALKQIQVYHLVCVCSHCTNRGERL